MEDDVQTIIALVSMSCPQILMKLVIMPAVAWDYFQKLHPFVQPQILATNLTNDIYLKFTEALVNDSR